MSESTVGSGKSKDERAAAVASTLAAGYRDGAVVAEDALRIIRHELRRRQTNKKLAILRRSVGAQAVIEAYAKRGVPLPKNGSPDALHADHVHQVTDDHLRKLVTVDDWLVALQRLGEVVCVTAAENYQLEVLEKGGTTGQGKYEAVGMTFVNPSGEPVTCWADATEASVTTS